jgi:ribosome biogenesis GTPase
VALISYDEDSAIIHQILPRHSVITRQAVGRYGERQVIAANVDCAFLVQAVDRDLNINRLERYLTICYSSGIDPVIVLTKTDLKSEEQVNSITKEIKKRVKDVPLLVLSNETKDGYDLLKTFIKRGKTYCLLGSSGVGKSTLLNNLSGREVMKTGMIGDHSNRGRHITSHRALVLLEDGGILIDNPGMREVGITDSSEGLENVFSQIPELADHCKFKDCTHTGETACAVIEAVNKGELDRKSYENYLKMEKEKNHFESTVAEKKKKEKQFGKILKDYHKKDVKGRRG